MSRLKVSSTTIEQGRTLVELGLDPNTADMHYHHRDTRSEALRWELTPYGLTTKENYCLRIERLNIGGLHKRPDGTPMTGEEVFEKMYSQDVPSWTADALISLLPTELPKWGKVSIKPLEDGGWYVIYQKEKDWLRMPGRTLLEAAFTAIQELLREGYVKPSDLKRKEANNE